MTYKCRGCDKELKNNFSLKGHYDGFLKQIVMCVIIDVSVVFVLKIFSMV